MVRSILALSSLALLASAAPVEKRQVRCAPSNGLYILVARGSTQAVGEGSVEPVGNLIEARLPGSYSHAIDYPASLVPYVSSVIDGIEDTKASIEDYVAACGESSRIALIGYSQGGNVITDTLAGGSGKPAPIAEKYRKNIVGVAVFADPSFNANQSYSRGTSTRNGIFARTGSLAALRSWSNVLVSYCDDNDLFCASGTSLEVHSAVVSKYAQQAADFIVGLAQ